MEKVFIVGCVSCAEYPYNQEGYPIAVYTERGMAEKLVEQLHAYLKSKKISYEYYVITEVLLNPEFDDVKPEFAEETN